MCLKDTMKDKFSSPGLTSLISTIILETQKSLSLSSDKGNKFLCLKRNSCPCELGSSGDRYFVNLKQKAVSIDTEEL